MEACDQRDCGKGLSPRPVLPSGPPIKAGNKVVGVVSVSGSPGKDDISSQAGIDKVADQLK